MNLRVFTFAILVSALPSLAFAGVTFDKNDFKSARLVSRNGEELVSVKLSKSGKSKVRRLSHTSVGEKVHAEIGGVGTDFRLREPIRGDGLEMGPYSGNDAQRVITAINAN